jgi:hypothetical protein
VGFHVNALSIDTFAEDFSKWAMHRGLRGGRARAQLAILDPTSTTQGLGVTENQFEFIGNLVAGK